MPRGCGTPGACDVNFSMNANQIALGEVSEWAKPSPKARPWYQVLESDAKTGSSFLGSLRASGQVTTDRLVVQNLVATHVSADVDLDAGKLEISDLKADFLGGKHRGEWRADFNDKQACDGRGSLTGISLARFANTMKDPWAEGTASASYDLKGICAAEFWPSAEGALRFEVKRFNVTSHFAGREYWSVEGDAAHRTGATTCGKVGDERCPDGLAGWEILVERDCVGETGTRSKAGEGRERHAGHGLYDQRNLGRTACGPNFES